MAQLSSGSSVAVADPTDRNWRKKASQQKCIQALLARGYTVFGVMHGSVPRFTFQKEKYKTIDVAFLFQEYQKDQD